VESWGVAKDGLGNILKLTPEDVNATYQRIVNPPAGASRCGPSTGTSGLTYAKSSRCAHMLRELAQQKRISHGLLCRGDTKLGEPFSRQLQIIEPAERLNVVDEFERRALRWLATSRRCGISASSSTTRR
jgi:hypothetical protein